MATNEVSGDFKDNRTCKTYQKIKATEIVNELFNTINSLDQKSDLLKSHDKYSSNTKKQLNNIQKNFNQIYKNSQGDKKQLESIGKYIDLSIKAYKDPTQQTIKNLNSHIQDNQLSFKTIEYKSTSYDARPDLVDQVANINRKLKKKLAPPVNNNDDKKERDRVAIDEVKAVIIETKTGFDLKFNKLSQELKHLMPNLSTKMINANEKSDKGKIIDNVKEQFDKILKNIDNKSSPQEKAILNNINEKINHLSTEYNKIKTYEKDIAKKEAQLLKGKIINSAPIRTIKKLLPKRLTSPGHRI